MKRTVILAALLLVLGGCDLPRPQAIQYTSNPSYEVELLFEHDGVKVYSFRHQGTRVYYTDARGNTQWPEIVHYGKGQTHTIHHVVSTAE